MYMFVCTLELAQTHVCENMPTRDKTRYRYGSRVADFTGSGSRPRTIAMAKTVCE